MEWMVEKPVHGCARIMPMVTPMASHLRSKWWASLAWATIPLHVSSTRKHFPHIRPRHQCTWMWLFADSWFPMDSRQNRQMVLVSMLDFWWWRMASFVWSWSNPNMILLLVSPVRVLRGFPLLWRKPWQHILWRAGLPSPSGHRPLASYGSTYTLPVV